MPTDTKISGYAEAPVGTLADDDLVVVVDVSDTSMAASGTTKKALGSTLKDYIGVATPTGLTLLDSDLIVHDPVKWLWLTNAEEIPGTNPDPYSAGILTASAVGAIPTAIENAPGVIPSIIPVGSAANVAVGVQIGDRLFWADNYNWGHQGIYVVTDLGSVATPWVLTRAADQPEADILLAFYVEVEDTDIVIRTTVPETSPEWIYPAVVTTPNGIAIGQSALATGTDAIAMGRFATASDTGTLAIGDYAIASGTNALAVGSNATATAFNSTAIGYAVSNSEAFVTKIPNAVIALAQSAPDTSTGNVVLDPTISLFWELDYLTTDMTFTTTNLLSGYTMTCALFNSVDIAPAAYNLTFPATWIFVGSARPTSLPASKHALLTVHCMLSNDDGCYVTWHVEP